MAATGSFNYDVIFGPGNDLKGEADRVLAASDVAGNLFFIYVVDHNRCGEHLPHNDSHLLLRSRRFCGTLEYEKITILSCGDHALDVASHSKRVGMRRIIIGFLLLTVDFYMLTIRMRSIVPGYDDHVWVFHLERGRHDDQCTAGQKDHQGRRGDL